MPGQLRLARWTMHLVQAAIVVLTCLTALVHSDPAQHATARGDYFLFCNSTGAPIHHALLEQMCTMLTGPCLPCNAQTGTDTCATGYKCARVCVCDITYISLHRPACTPHHREEMSCVYAAAYHKGSYQVRRVAARQPSTRRVDRSCGAPQRGCSTQSMTSCPCGCHVPRLRPSRASCGLS